jgi:hypothetical protein
LQIFTDFFWTYIQNINKIFLIKLSLKYLKLTKYLLINQICKTCEKFNIQLLSLQKNKELDQINQIKNELELYKNEAKKFYEMKNRIKNELSSDRKQAVICYDFQKNLQMPQTNVSVEYYLRKFFCYNFGLHDLKTNSAVMYLYPENFAKKGSDEVISFINFYIRNIMSKEVKVLHIFSDNAFSQNKNKFLWAFYKQSIDYELLEKIIIYYPNPGHSVMEIDGDFGRIEINKKITKKYIFHQNMKK